MTLSVVIPAFDEEETIGTCLDLLGEQMEHIAEIIVVDNNSTDATRAVVEARSATIPSIRLITEPRQGLVFARNTGLDAATSDAVARIDADTRVPPDWAQTIVAFLESDTDERWAAFCGRGEAYDLPYGDAAATLKARFSPLAARRGPRTDVREVPVLYGSNMILRRSTWHRIRRTVSMRRDVFEDVDMGLCVQAIGGRNAFLPHLTVGVSPRRMESSMRAFVVYMACLPRTLALHRRYALAVGAALVYLPGVALLHAARLLVIRAYDKESHSFRIRALLTPTADRAMP